MTDENRRHDDERTREIAREAATQAVHETLTGLGIDADNPMEAQQDAAMLRRLRKAKERGVIALVLAMGGALLAASWQWIKTSLTFSGGG